MDVACNEEDVVRWVGNPMSMTKRYRTSPNEGKTFNQNRDDFTSAPHFRAEPASPVFLNAADQAEPTSLRRLRINGKADCAGLSGTPDEIIVPSVLSNQLCIQVMGRRHGVQNGVELFWRGWQALAGPGLKNLWRPIVLASRRFCRNDSARSRERPELFPDFDRHVPQPSQPDNRQAVPLSHSQWCNGE